MHAASTSAAGVVPKAITPTARPSPALIDEVHRAAETEVPSGPREAVETELESEEEEKEHEPELGDELRHLGRD